MVSNDRYIDSLSISSLCNHTIWPGIWPPRSNSRSKTGCRYRPEITSAGVPKWSQTIAILSKQPTQLWPLTWHLTFYVKFMVKARDTGYRPDIRAAYVPKWSQTIGSLPEQLAQLWPLTLHLTFKVKFKIKGRGTGHRPKITPEASPRGKRGQLAPPPNLQSGTIGDRYRSDVILGLE